MGLLRFHLAAIPVCLGMVSMPVWGKKKHQHAHEHGVAKLAIASEGLKVVFELDTPAEGLYGFEHEPKTEADQKIVQNAHLRLTDRTAELFRFQPDFGCTVKTAVVKKEETEHAQPKTAHAKTKKQPSQETHSDVTFKAEFICAKPVAGSKVIVALIKEFPNMKTIKAQILTENTQKSDTLKKPEQEVSL